MENIEHHPLDPFLPASARILMLGSFPPPRARWSMDFYYPNLQNDMWRVMGLAFFGDKAYFAEGKKFDEARIREFCTTRGIALSDTARAVVRLGGNASDDMLQVVERVDLAALLEKLPQCRAIITTGGKATDTLMEITGAPKPAVGSFVEFVYAGRQLRLWRMPSTSRAYPLALERKAEAYAMMLASEGLL